MTLQKSDAKPVSCRNGSADDALDELEHADSEDTPHAYEARTHLEVERVDRCRVE